MTRSDAWKQRPCVVKYRAWADECRLAATENPLGKIQAETIIGIYAFFHLPMPESHSNAKKAALYGRLHNQKPDTDNLLKGLCDALLEEDKAVSFMQGVKFYVEEGEEPRTDVFIALG